jgi:preprotein translocase subunit SecD
MSDYFDRVERQIVRRVEDGVPRSRRLRIVPGHLAVAAAVIVVIVVAGVFLLARGAGGGGNPAPAGHSDVTVVLGGPPAHVPAPVLDDGVRILRERMRAVYPDVTVTRAAQNIVVDLPNAPAGARRQILALAAPGRLAFYDWEADVIAPNGKTVASQLGGGDPTVIAISQGEAGAAPGEPGAGGVSLQQARARVRKAAVRGRFALIQAADPDPRHPIAPDAPNARFYVVRVVPSVLSEAGIKNPHAGRDPTTGSPEVTFGFTAAGGRAFQSLTRTIARRGSLVSGLGHTLNQHFAVALDDQLIEVPFIDFKQYPDGISGDAGAALLGNFTRQSARDLAILLRYGPLPLDLRARG